MTAQTIAAPTARGISDRVRIARDYRLYLEARYSAAETACVGILVNADGAARGISPRRNWFSGRNGSLKYASDELRDWFAANGPTMTATAFRLAQTPTETPEDVPADVVVDTAGVGHIVAYREYAECAYTVCEMWCDPAVSAAPTGVVCGVCGPVAVEAPTALLEPVAAPVAAPTPALQSPVIVGPVDREATRCDRCGCDHKRGTVPVVTGDGVQRLGLACAARALGVEVGDVRAAARAA